MILVFESLLFGLRLIQHHVFSLLYVERYPICMRCREFKGVEIPYVCIHSRRQFT